MATVDLRRLLNRHQKNDISVFTTDLDFTVDIGVTADISQLFELPLNSYIVRAEILIIIANDAGTSAVANLGFGGDDTLVDGADLQATAGAVEDAGTNAVVPVDKLTGGIVTFVPTYVGTASTVGKCKVIIEYIEYEKHTGEYTNIPVAAA